MYIEPSYIEVRGYDGILLKNTPADWVIRAIRTANAGESVLSPEATLAVEHQLVR